MAQEGKGVLRRFPIWQTLLLDLALSALRGAVAAGIVWRKRRRLESRLHRPLCGHFWPLDALSGSQKTLEGELFESIS